MSVDAVATPVKERPILFSGPMVRAILAGTKTQTRRVVRLPGGAPWRLGHVDEDGASFARANRTVRGVEVVTEGWEIPCPYGVAGERLWVRETWALVSADDHSAFTARAERMPAGKTLADTDGGLDRFIDLTDEQAEWAHAHVDPERWRPSIHMPRWASRLTLEISEVRVQRLQEISDEAAAAEGMDFRPIDTFPGVKAWHAPDGWSHKTARGAFDHAWESINGKRAPWASNPWVWAITFKRLAWASPSSCKFPEPR